MTLLDEQIRSLVNQYSWYDVLEAVRVLCPSRVNVEIAIALEEHLTRQERQQRNEE